MQQEPKTGCGQVLGEQVVIVETHWLFPVHNCWRVSEQVLAVTPQQAPIGQVLGEQAVTPLVQILGDTHAACGPMVHAPAVVQHDPCGGWGHGAPPPPATQVCPLVHTLGEVH